MATSTTSAAVYDRSLMSVFEVHELLIDVDADASFVLWHEPPRSPCDVHGFVVGRPQIVALADFLSSPLGVRLLERARASLDEDLARVHQQRPVPEELAEWIREQTEDVQSHVR